MKLRPAQEQRLSVESEEVKDEEEISEGESGLGSEDSPVRGPHRILPPMEPKLRWAAPAQPALTTPTTSTAPTTLIPKDLKAHIASTDSTPTTHTTPSAPTTPTASYCQEGAGRRSGACSACQR